MTLSDKIDELEANARKFYRDKDWLMLRQTWLAWNDLMSMHSQINDGWLDLVEEDNETV